MPTNTNAYNSRVTDEALEKRFRDTFRSQGGAELVDDLYAQGVIVPVVDFTAAATGQQLGENLQTAWDFSTTAVKVTSLSGSPTTLISNSGFWQVDLTCNWFSAATPSVNWVVQLNDGSTTKPIWALSSANTSTLAATSVVDGHFVVYLRAGDTLEAYVGNTSYALDIWFRQIATVSGDLVNPTGFTSS